MTTLSTNGKSDNPAERIVLLAEVLAFETRLGKRGTRDTRAARNLVAAVREVASVDVERAQRLFDTAVARYREVLGKENQMWYFLGAFCSILFIGLAAALMIHMPQEDGSQNTLANLASPSQLVSLVYFACTGALASMIMRLPNIGMSNEERRFYVFFSASLPPLVAVCFMGVVYVILLTGVVSFNLGLEGTPKTGSTWIAAFLCGFSEKFAPSLLALTEAAMAPPAQRKQPKPAPSHNGTDTNPA